MRRHKNPVHPTHIFTQSEHHAATTGRDPLWCIAETFLEREKARKEKSDAFAYHGCSNRLHPLHDFYKAMHSIKELKKPVSFEHPHKESFVFLRNHTLQIPSLFAIDRPTTRGNLPNKNGKHLDDHDTELRKQLLACSYSLFDEVYGESALYFFKKNFSQLLRCNSDAIIDEQFEQLDKKYEIRKIYEKLKSTTGNLLQIIIPQHIVDECVYVCRPYGFTYHINFDDNPFPFKNDELGILQFIDQVRGGKFNPDRWQGQPQLRVALTSRYFANPQSGIEIYRHTDSTEDAINEFMAARNTLYAKINSDLEKI